MTRVAAELEVGQAGRVARVVGVDEIGRRILEDSLRGRCSANSIRPCCLTVTAGAQAAICNQRLG